MHVAPGEPGDLIAMMAVPPPGLRLTLKSNVYRLVQAQMLVSETYALFEGPDDPVPFALVGGAVTRFVGGGSGRQFEAESGKQPGAQGKGRDAKHGKDAGDDPARLVHQG